MLCIFDGWLRVAGVQVEVYRAHLEHNRKQRQRFSEECATVSVGQAVVLLDFKENVIIGTGPIEVSHSFYERVQRTVLGYVVYTRDAAGNCVRKHHVNVVSEVLSHDGLFVRDTFAQVLHKHCPGVRVASVWMDCGPHFRNGEVLSFLLGDLPKLGLRVSVNFFVEHHGKSPCDTHFSLLSRWLDNLTLRKPVYSTESLLSGWREQAKESKSRDEITFELYQRAVRPPTLTVIEIPNVKMYYAFRSKPAGSVDVAAAAKCVCLDARVLSVDPDTLAQTLTLKVKAKADSRQNRVPRPDPAPCDAVSEEVLESRRVQIVRQQSLRGEGELDAALLAALARVSFSDRTLAAAPPLVSRPSVGRPSARAAATGRRTTCTTAAAHPPSRPRARIHPYTRKPAQQNQLQHLQPASATSAHMVIVVHMHACCARISMCFGRSCGACDGIGGCILLRAHACVYVLCSCCASVLVDYCRASDCVCFFSHALCVTASCAATATGSCPAPTTTKNTCTPSCSAPSTPDTPIGEHAHAYGGCVVASARFISPVLCCIARVLTAVSRVREQCS
jgi:hypothetical protein